MSNPSSASASATPLLERGVDRLDKEIDILEERARAMEVFTTRRLESASSQLTAYSVTHAEGRLAQYIREQKGQEVRSWLRRGWEYLRSRFNERLVQLLYQRSEGVLMVRRLQALDNRPKTLVEASLSLLDTVAPAPSVEQALPHFYKQLYLGSPTLSRELWIGWQAEQEAARHALARYRQGFHGGLLILGEPLSGKTALSRLIAAAHFKADRIFYLDPPGGERPTIASLEARLKAALGNHERVQDCFARLPKDSTLVVNDLTQWWERTPDGFAALDQLMAWIDTYGASCFFILNANQDAYQFINKAKPLHQHFIGTVVCAPSNAEEIKEIILLRHRSTGYSFAWNGQMEQDLPAWKVARLFSTFFDYARGNVGMALQAWIAHIEKVEGEHLIITTPETPEVDLLANMTSLQKALLLHFVLHEKLTLERLAHITALEEQRLSTALHTLGRAGLLIQTNRIWRINRFMVPHLIHAFRKEGLLP